MIFELFPGLPKIQEDPPASLPSPAGRRRRGAPDEGTGDGRARAVIAGSLIPPETDLGDALAITRALHAAGLTARDFADVFDEAAAFARGLRA